MNLVPNNDPKFHLKQQKGELTLSFFRPKQGQNVAGQKDVG